MERLLFLLSQKGKIKVDISQYVSVGMAYADGDVVISVTNRLKTIQEDEFGINEEPKFQIVKLDGKTNKQDKVLEGFMAIPEFEDYVQGEYNNIFSMNAEVLDAKETFLYFAQWNDKISYEDKEKIEKVIELLNENSRIKISNNEYLILADYTDRQASPNNELHIQLVKQVRTPNGIKTTYPELYDEELLYHINHALKQNPKEREKYLEVVSFNQQLERFNKNEALKKLKNNFIQQGREMI